MTKKTALRLCALTLALGGAFATGLAVAAKPAAKIELTGFNDLTWTPLMKEGPLPAAAAACFAGCGNWTTTGAGAAAGV